MILVELLDNDNNNQAVIYCQSRNGSKNGKLIKSINGSRGYLSLIHHADT